MYIVKLCLMTLTFFILLLFLGGCLCVVTSRVSVLLSPSSLVIVSSMWYIYIYVDRDRYIEVYTT